MWIGWRWLCNSAWRWSEQKKQWRYSKSCSQFQKSKGCRCEIPQKAEITLRGKSNIFTFRSRYLSFDLAHQLGIFFSKAKKKNQKYDFSFQFFNRSLVKSRRTAKRPTVLNSLLPMLTIPITLGKIYFLTNFRIFCKGGTLVFFGIQIMVKNTHFLVVFQP